MNPHARVVVTGMGIVAPNGIGLDAYWDSLIHGRSGIGPITLFDTSNLPLKIAGEIRNFNLRDYTGTQFKPQRLARQTQFALAACKMAIEDARITLAEHTRTGPIHLVMGVCSGAVDVMGEGIEALLTRGVSRVKPHAVGASQPHAMGAAIVQMLGEQTTVTTISAACPSGLDAMAAAMRLIRQGKADMVLIGAADSPLNYTLASFCAGGIPSLTTRYAPEHVSRPFDAGRTGVVLSEGAGFLVLERMESALARGAVPYVEVIGGAAMTDAPGREGMEGLYHSMNNAMKDAGIVSDQVDYICANACSDKYGDQIEVDKIKALFGAHARHLSVSSIRGCTGHPLAAAGLFQLVACALMLRRQTICPTANLTAPDPGCDLDHVPLLARLARIDIVMANGHGMGGENSTIILRRPR